MSAWECRGCTAAYAVDAPRCPQCGVNDPIDEAEQLRRENEDMPKITVAGGPSNADAEQPDEAVTATVDEADQAAAEVEETPPVEATDATEEKQAPARKTAPKRGTS